MVFNETTGVLIYRRIWFGIAREFETNTEKLMKFICPCLSQQDAADYILKIEAIMHPLLLFIIVILCDKYYFRFDQYPFETKTEKYKIEKENYCRL